MNKRERVLNALAGKPVDHVPVGFWYHFQNEEASGLSCVKAHLKYYRQTDLDFVKIMCDGYFFYPFPEIHSADEWWNLKPLGKDHPFIREQVERAKKIVEQIGAERCVFYNVFAPFSSIRFTNGDEKIMEHLRANPQAVMHALDVIAQDNADLAEALIREAGCDGIYYCCQGGEYDRFTEEEYRKWIRPSDLYVLERANRFSDNNILHLCGFVGRQNRLKMWSEYPAKAVNWAVHVENVSLEEGRLLFGGRTCLGGFETHFTLDGTYRQGLMYDGTKEQIQEYTRNLILNFGKRGLILGGDCTFDARMDNKRLTWIVEAARSI